MFERITAGTMPDHNTVGEHGLTSVSSLVLSEVTYKKGTEIFGEHEPAEYAYQVKSGAVKSSKLLSDGRRHISAFHLVGDIFGLTSRETHRFTAEAIVDTSLWLIKRQTLEEMAKADSVVTRNLLIETSRNLRHAENHLILLGRKAASERVAAFLLEMNNRVDDVAPMTLPMPRRDIADYLGMTLETVSRELSRLRRAGAVAYANGDREIKIINRRSLLLFHQS